MQEQNNFKYIFKGEEVSKEQFIKLAKESFKWFSDNTIQAVDFDSVSKFFSGDYKSDNEIAKHFKGVLDSQSDNYFMSDHFSKINKGLGVEDKHKKEYPNLGDYLNKEDELFKFPPQKDDKIRKLNKLYKIESFLKSKEEQKIIEDWNKKEFYITPPTKENLEKMCDSFEQRVKNDSDKCGNINYVVPECHSKIGQKHNEGKLPLDIMLTVQFPKAIQAVCKATLFGHEKYKDTDLDWLNYKRVRGGSTTYANACQRHNFNKSGKDDQSGLPHIVHKCWNALAELELWIEENKYE